MRILGIETSGALGSIALIDGEGPAVAQPLELGRRHAQSLIPAVRQLLADHGLRPRDVDVVAVSIGPGSFTGLRVGVVFAKTLAYASGAGIVAIETSIATACNAGPGVSELEVITDAQRGDLFVCHYQRTGGGPLDWQPTRPLQVCPAIEWRAQRPPALPVTGPGLEQQRDLLMNPAAALPPELWTPSAATIAALARPLWEAGQRADMWGLEPLYVRRSSAEDAWDRRRASAIGP